MTQTASGTRGCRGGCGSCSNPRPRDCSSCTSAPRRRGQVPRSPSGTAEPDPVGPEAGQGAEPQRSSRLSWVFNTGTSSGLSSAPPRTIPCPGWDRDTAVCLSPVPRRAPGALEPVVGWCRAAPSTLLGSSWAPRLCWDHCLPLLGMGRGDLLCSWQPLRLRAPRASSSSGSDGEELPLWPKEGEISRQEKDLAQSCREGSLGTWRSGCGFPWAVGAGSCGFVASGCCGFGSARRRTGQSRARRPGLHLVGFDP